MDQQHLAALSLHLRDSALALAHAASAVAQLVADAGASAQAAQAADAIKATEPAKPSKKPAAKKPAAQPEQTAAATTEPAAPAAADLGPVDDEAFVTICRSVVKLDPGMFKGALAHFGVARASDLAADKRRAFLDHVKAQPLS